MDKIYRDTRLLYDFTELYCSHHHKQNPKSAINLKGVLKQSIPENACLCNECKEVFLYGAGKRLACRQNPKPPCKKCPNPCYNFEYQQKIKEIMKFSGKKMILKGRPDLLFKYFF
jgi:hypothetical protein